MKRKAATAGIIVPETEFLAASELTCLAVRRYFPLKASCRVPGNGMYRGACSAWEAHSDRRACIGGIELPRYAGINAARRADNASVAPAAERTIGSYWLSP